MVRSKDRIKSDHIKRLALCRSRIKALHVKAKELQKDMKDIKYSICKLKESLKQLNGSDDKSHQLEESIKELLLFTKEFTDHMENADHFADIMFSDIKVIARNHKVLEDENGDGIPVLQNCTFFFEDQEDHSLTEISERRARFKNGKLKKHCFCLTESGLAFDQETMPQKIINISNLSKTALNQVMKDYGHKTI